MRWLDYVVYRFNTKLKLKEDSKTTCNFIYNLSENSTDYQLWENSLFAGCATHMVADGSKLSTDEHKQLFSRGYLDSQLDRVAKSRNVSDGANYLGHYVLTQNGKPKLNTKEHKVIAATYSKLLT